MTKSITKSDKPIGLPVAEDWKHWELTPVPTGRYTAADTLSHSDLAARSVQTAIDRLDKQ